MNGGTGSGAAAATGGGVTNENEVGLPPLQQSRRAVWDYYRIEFLEDGFPGRRVGDELHAHPIYGTYVISDYLSQYRRCGDPELLRAAARVADAAVARMEPVQDALALMYRPEGTGVANRRHHFYSGLTQARYVDSLAKLMHCPGQERFREPWRAILGSLAVPVESGGVARRTESGGLIIEEYPALFPDCTLNGWTTATCILSDLAQRTNDPEGVALYQQSVQGLEDVIDLFDAPIAASSRYRLSGPAAFSIRCEGDARPELLGCEIEVPGSGVFAANRTGDPAGHVLDGARTHADPNEIAFTVELSRLSWPRSNRLHLRIRADRPGRAAVSIAQGTYEPLRKSLRATGSTRIAEVELVGGERDLAVTVPWTAAELVAYPTNFAKAIAGRQFNQYHWIHVDTLSRLVDTTGSEKLSHYRDRWACAPDQWHQMLEYQDSRITLERFDPHVHRSPHPNSS